MRESMKIGAGRRKGGGKYNGVDVLYASMMSAQETNAKSDT